MYYFGGNREKMKTELQQISKELKNRYKIGEKTAFETDVVEAKTLLTEKRLDLGAKLYYIQCYLAGEGLELAEMLYRKHLSSMQYEVFQGIDDTEKLDESLHNFQNLIELFKEDKMDLDSVRVPVGYHNEVLDCSHITACSIYFHKKLTIIRFPEIEGECFDFDTFYQNGLEQGYLELMATAFAIYRNDCVGRWSIGENNHYRKMADLKRAIEDAGYHMVYAKKLVAKKEKGWYYVFYSERKKKLSEEVCCRHLEEIKEALEFDTKEQAQEIEVSKEEALRCKKVRNLKCKQTKHLLAVRKALNLPIKKNIKGYTCAPQKSKQD